MWVLRYQLSSSHCVCVELWAECREITSINTILFPKIWSRQPDGVFYTKVISYLQHYTIKISRICWRPPYIIQKISLYSKKLHIFYLYFCSQLLWNSHLLLLKSHRLNSLNCVIGGDMKLPALDWTSFYRMSLIFQPLQPPSLEFCFL